MPRNPFAVNSSASSPNGPTRRASEPARRQGGLYRTTALSSDKPRRERSPRFRTSGSFAAL